MSKFVDFLKRGFNERAFLWARLSDDVTPVNLATYFFAVFMTIASYTFINAAQPYVLETVLDLEDVGKATGDLGFYNELLIISTVWIWGLLSDKIGRKPVYFFAFFFMSLGTALYPFATSFGVLVGYRLIFALGASASAAMMTSVLADYVITEDKGGASGWTGVFSGCGALLAALILLQIPSWSSMEPIPAGRLMYLVSAGLIHITGWIVLIGFQRKPQNLAAIHETPYHILLWDGLKAGWYDPRLALAYCSGFVARGDALVLTTFLSLWVQDYARDELGHSDEEAISLAGSITGVAQTFALIFALPAGLLASKVDSVLSLLIVSLVAFLGYLSITFTEDPTGGYGMFCACIIGIGEIGVIVVAQALVSRQAPPKVRGSVGGTAGLFGSCGILFCSKLGGYLYDEYDPTGPFLLFACFNGALMIAGIFVYFRTRNQYAKENPINRGADEESRLLGEPGSVDTKDSKQ